MKRWIVIFTVLFAVLFFMRGTLPPSHKPAQFNTHAFGELPILYDGRKKPIDTFARNLLIVLSARQTVRLSDGDKIDATTWLLDTVTGRPGAVDAPVFRIDNLDLLAHLDLAQRKGFRYTYREVAPSLKLLETAAHAASDKPARQRDAYDRDAIKAAHRLNLYQQVTAAFEDPSAMPAAQLPYAAQRYHQLERAQLPLLVPPSTEVLQWRPLMSVLLAAHPLTKNPAVDVRATQLGVMLALAAYRTDQPELFNSTVLAYRHQLKVDAPDVLEKLAFETFYYRLDAFMKSAILYLAVFLLGCFGWLTRRRMPVVAATTLMICTFIPHTFAIAARCYISGYPPVTNLYSTAIFIGWGAVLSGLLLERMARNAAGLGCLAGGLAGFATLLIANALTGDGDTMEQMRAVLNTRFWLTMHVVTIALGYMAVLVAGTMGLFYILAGIFSRRLDAATRTDMSRMIYATACFALLFSFLGTVLGGLWADDSWGRFWGWDPKENGALLLVIWLALMQHARSGQKMTPRGFAVMAVFGNVVTAWSWFGVNQLGVGLHSYGFTDAAGLWLPLFVVSQLVVIGIGLLPLRLWRSHVVRVNDEFLACDSKGMK